MTDRCVHVLASAALTGFGLLLAGCGSSDPATSTETDVRAAESSVSAKSPGMPPMPARCCRRMRWARSSA